VAKRLGRLGLEGITMVDSCPPRYRRQQSMKRHSRIAAHPRPVNNETPLASAKHDPNSPTDRSVKLLSVDEGGLAQGPTRDDAHPQHSFGTHSGLIRVAAARR